MDPEGKPEPRHGEPERSAPPAALLTASETSPDLAAAWAEWLRDRGPDR